MGFFFRLLFIGGVWGGGEFFFWGVGSPLRIAQCFPAVLGSKSRAGGLRGLGGAGRAAGAAASGAPPGSQPAAQPRGQVPELGYPEAGFKASNNIVIRSLREIPVGEAIPSFKIQLSSVICCNY